jgi:hypothetical protein
MWINRAGVVVLAKAIIAAEYCSATKYGAKRRFQGDETKCCAAINNA